MAEKKEKSEREKVVNKLGYLFDRLRREGYPEGGVKSVELYDNVYCWLK